jgi:hypothetical protein
MIVSFLLLSILGLIVFFSTDNWALGVLYVGLTGNYASASLGCVRKDLPPKVGEVAWRSLGFFHVATALWLIYLVYAVTLNYILNYHLPV